MPPVKRTKFKKGKRRAAARQPAPQQCVDWLAASDLRGVLARGAVWMAVVDARARRGRARGRAGCVRGQCTDDRRA